MYCNAVTIMTRYKKTFAAQGKMFAQRQKEVSKKCAMETERLEFIHSLLLNLAKYDVADFISRERGG